MGRKAKYTTKEARLEAGRLSARKYYEQNKVWVKEKRMKRYWKSKK